MSAPPPRHFSTTFVFFQLLLIADKTTVLYQTFVRCVFVYAIAINEFSYYLTSASQSIFIEFMSRDGVCVYVCVYMCYIGCSLYIVSMCQTIKGNELEGLKLNLSLMR